MAVVKTLRARDDESLDVTLEVSDEVVSERRRTVVRLLRLESTYG